MYIDFRRRKKNTSIARCFPAFLIHFSSLLILNAIHYSNSIEIGIPFVPSSLLVSPTPFGSALSFPFA